MQNILLADINRKGGTQMRAAINDSTVETYADYLEDGAEFPAVVVFYDGTDYWLADGFHRCAAYVLAGMAEVPADVRSGSRLDAIVYALKANSTNGRPRTDSDMRRAYDVAVQNELCDPTDTEKVKGLLGCSLRWARDLTKAARDIAKAERDAEIQRLSEEGKPQRAIAEEVGVSQQTVMRASDPKRNSSEMDQNEEPETPEVQSPEEPEPKEPPKSRGVGMKYAHEAIAVLKRIPLNDGLRQDAFNTVADWIKTNRG